VRGDQPKQYRCFWGEAYSFNVFLGRPRRHPRLGTRLNSVDSRTILLRLWSEHSVSKGSRDKVTREGQQGRWEHEKNLQKNSHSCPNKPLEQREGGSETAYHHLRIRGNILLFQNVNGRSTSGG